MKKLNLHPVSFVDELAWPEQAQPLNLSSASIYFFTDFSLSTPLVIEDSVTAVEAREMMIRTHVRLKLVVDSNKRFKGVITAEDLSEQNILAHITAGRLKRTDVSVRDLMTDKAELLALDIEEVSRSSIGDVVNFLKDNHRQHCLVVDGGVHRIRGIFSASDISRKLKLPIDIQEASSFFRVFKALA